MSVEATAKKIFFEAVFESLPQHSPNGQLICSQCGNNESVIDLESHDCYYMTVPGYVRANMHQLVEKAGREKITNELVRLARDRQFPIEDVMTEVYAHFDPYERLITNEKFAAEFISFVKQRENEEKINEKVESEDFIVPDNEFKEPKLERQNCFMIPSKEQKL